MSETNQPIFMEFPAKCGIKNVVCETKSVICMTSESFSGVYLIFLVNQSAGQALSGRYQPNCKLTSLAIESQ